MQNPFALGTHKHIHALLVSVIFYLNNELSKVLTQINRYTIEQCKATASQNYEMNNNDLLLYLEITLLVVDKYGKYL
jgi:hypothetical protein